MSFTYGFYNSLNGDRKYDAIQFGQLFDGIIKDGVFMSIGEHLNVTAFSGMQIKVGTGRAWFNSTWSYNDSSLILDVAASSTLLGRIDMVVLEVNRSSTTRATSIKILQGTPSSSPVVPTLTNDADAEIWQHPLAQLYIAAGVTEITQSAITNKIGTSECPFVTGVLETMDIDDLIAQWGTEWDEWMSARVNEVAKLISDSTTDMTTFKTEQQQLFNEWFANIQYTLDGDAAGKLQNEIDNLKGSTTTDRLLASSWSNGQYTFEAAYPAASYDLHIYVPNTATLAQSTAWNNAKILPNNTANILIASGDIPTIDIPIIIKAVKK